MKYPRIIYAIQHQITKKMYIGSSANVEDRLKSHLIALRSRKHTNKQLQEDFNKYGENYKFYILGEISDSNTKRLEYDFQFKYKTKDPKYGYNSKDNGGTGIKIKLEEGLPKDTL